MVIRRATRNDLARVASLLETAALPPLPAALPLANIFVALEDATVTGAIALQVIGLRGLVWPEAVDPAHRGNHVRASLLKTLLARAHELSLRELYLLTEKNVEFFTGFGFLPIPHEVVPAEILSAREYRAQCSTTANVMRLELATRFV